MNAMTCELCGGNDIVKQDGLYVCQHCGTKYSVEDAKKLIGTVRIDKTDELSNLYVLARRARADLMYSEAQKYYSRILLQDPNNWEPVFFQVYCQAMECKVSEVVDALVLIMNCIPSTFDAISGLETDKQSEALNEIVNSVLSISKMLEVASQKFFYQNYNASGDSEAIGQFLINEHSTQFNMLNVLGGGVKTHISENDAQKYMISIAKRQVELMINQQNAWVDANPSVSKKTHESCLKVINDLAEHIRQCGETNYQPPSPKTPPSIFPNTGSSSSSSGCYIATCVYGSYNCPPVWTLRRFRDSILSKTWYGRLFIRIYYSVSPTVVKLFGNKVWFRALWLYRLDILVAKLQNNGIDSTIYQDRQW